MAIIDEPVRGSVPPLWWWSLPGLERIQALARGYIPLPPLCRLLGIRPGHVGPGSGTWTMPASGWLQTARGDMEITVFADAALQGIAMTLVAPGFTIEPLTFDANHFRPVRPTLGKFIARGRVLNASRFFTCTEVQIEDPDGRQLFQATSHAEIRRVSPEPPPAPANLGPIEEASYVTPDPYLRPATAYLPSLEDWENGLRSRRYFDLFVGHYKVPYIEMLGLSLDTVERKTVRATIPSSEWFCLFNKRVSPGIILSAINYSATTAGLTRLELNHSFVGLAQHNHIYDSVPADGRPMRIEVGYTGTPNDGNMDIRLFDADGRLISQHFGFGRYVDSGQRERPATAQAKRMLCTLLFTDIVGSTQHAEQLGDQKWHALLDEQRKKIRAEISRCHGTEIDTAGDGFFVRFDSPAEALDCAAAAREAVKPLGIEIRAGVHTGECEVTGRNYAGMAVHIGARIMAAAGPNEVFVSSTVKDLVMGSGRAFVDRGEHDLKGVPGAWRLYALV